MAGDRNPAGAFHTAQVVARFLHVLAAAGSSRPLSEPRSPASGAMTPCHLDDCRIQQGDPDPQSVGDARPHLQGAIASRAVGVPTTIASVISSAWWWSIKVLRGQASWRRMGSTPTNISCTKCRDPLVPLDANLEKILTLQGALAHRRRPRFHRINPWIDRR